MSEANFGKYRLLAELGHGGMADVFLAVMAGPEGSGFSKLTVVKRLRQNLADEPEFVEMLVDEARISARLNHPNVVQTNEVGAVGNQYFLAMEYLDGQPLHRIQHRAAQVAQRNAGGAAAGARPSAPPSGAGGDQVLPKECQYLVVVDTLAGLHHAHELTDYDGTPLQIVHRDVTPHNVFVTYQGQVKVVDFGIAKAVGRASETRQGVVKGKVRYMAPEQAMGRLVDRRADVFSVGVMLWEIATGRRLWKDVDDLAIVQALISGQIPSSPKLFNDAIPDEIDRICRRALAGNVEERYATAEEFRLELEQYLAETGALVHARRRLGAVVNELFADKRNEIRGIIERQLAAIRPSLNGSSSSSVPFHLSSPPGLRGSSGMEAMAVNVESDNVTRATALSNAVTSVYTGNPQRPDAPPVKKKGRAVVAAAVGTGLAVAAVGLAFAGGLVAPKKAPGATTMTTEVPNGSSATSVSSVTSAATTANREVLVSLDATPPTARISIDGVAVPAPFRGRYTRDGVEHTIKVEASGYETQVATLKFEEDVSRSFSLTRLRAAPPQAWHPPPRTPTTGNSSPVVQPAPPPPAAPPTPAASKEHAPKPTIDNTDPWGKKN